MILCDLFDLGCFLFVGEDAGCPCYSMGPAVLEGPVDQSEAAPKETATGHLSLTSAIANAALGEMDSTQGEISDQTTGRVRNLFVTA